MIFLLQKFLLLEEVESNTKPLMPNNDNTSISIKNVDASWTEKSIANTLHDITVTIPQKKLYAIVGPVGAGKVRKKFLHYTLAISTNQIVDFVARVYFTPQIIVLTDLLRRVPS